MNNYQSKFQQLLRELFQFDSADLDFGIYRIMNHKREVIERFITEDLPQAIAEELERGALVEQSRATQALDAARKKVLDALEDDALDAEGNLAAKYSDTKAGQKYLAAQAQAAGARDHQALEAAIYNHLYTFFSRYYQDGDFISKRRYSKRERYAIPYNGEEVYLYWANHDQYYIKTAEHFSDYTWKAPNGVTMHFKLKAADVEQNNVKGDKRFFLPRPDEIAWDEGRDELTIPCEYRPLTGQEAIAYGKSKQQEAIIAKALEAIPAKLKGNARALAALSAERRKTAGGDPVSYLEHHLRRYTSRNTSDFFIHKDLQGFLSRELDFYLKNEVLNLEEMEAAGEGLAEGWFQLLRLIKAVGGRIIEFLAQIENLQKMLWEKRKFVTETFYCITLGQIDAAFYPEIAACDPQWDEWLALYHIDDPKIPKDRPAFLEAHPTLVLDTRYFDRGFVDRLLASFDDLDEMTNGLLVHGENWQALNLLGEKYREEVKCVHIDPPYNTQTSGFLYKNDYQHSSWLAMMKDRVSSGLSCLKTSGIFACHIDESEVENLHFLLERSNLVNAGTLVWDKGMPTTGAIGLAMQHEYVLFCSLSPKATIRVRKKNVSKMHDRIREILEQCISPTKDAIAQYRKWLKSQASFSKSERTYDQFDETGRAFRSDNMSATDRRTNPKFYIPLKHPVTKQDCPVPEYGWRYTPESMQKLLQDSLLLFGEDHTTMPRKKTYLESTSESQMPSVFRSGSRGKTSLDSLDLEFSFAHTPEFYSYIIDSSTDKGDWVLDYFAGSGTTGHAVINLNREDGGRRKFILVEMAGYFDTVLLPRIKKVAFTPEWKDGQPRRMATEEEAERGPRIIKVLRLESYEDALNNIAFDDTAGQQAMQFDDYLLRYMLKWETRHSETLLNVEKLSHPFSYQLHIHHDGETRVQPVDLPETFNYLLGLHVQTRKVYDDDGRQYRVYRGVLRNGRSVAVIWRETGGWEQADYERDKQFVAEHKLTTGADEIYVNGDALIPGARALDDLFKARMFAEVEG